MVVNKWKKKSEMAASPQATRLVHLLAELVKTLLEGFA